MNTDCISRQAVIDLMMQKWGEKFSADDAMQESIDAIRVMPSVTPQLSSELEKNSKKLEKDFGELDCISRAEAIKCLECDFDITGNGAWWECSKCHAERAYGNEYCPDCGSHNGDIAKMVEPQESER